MYMCHVHTFWVLLRAPIRLKSRSLVEHRGMALIRWCNKKIHLVLHSPTPNYDNTDYLQGSKWQSMINYLHLRHRPNTIASVNFTEVEETLQERNSLTRIGQLFLFSAFAKTYAITN